MPALKRSRRELYNYYEKNNVYYVEIPLVNGHPGWKHFDDLHRALQKQLDTTESVLWYTTNTHTKMYCIQVQTPHGNKKQLNRHRTLKKIKEVLETLYPETRKQRIKRLKLRRVK